MKRNTDATSKSLSSVTHGTLWFQIETKLKRKVSYLTIHVFFRKVLVMHGIDFIVILKFCVKQLTLFGRTVVAASDFKNCTMVNCKNNNKKRRALVDPQSLIRA